MESLGPAVAEPDTPRGKAPGSPRATNLAAWIALFTLAGVWSWWAAKEGAYFGAVMYPGLVVLCAGLLLVSSRAAWRPALVLSLPAKVTLGALIALGAWSALSAIWSPAPDIAVADAQRILGYALAFGLGIWLSVLAGKRVHLAMVPLAVAGVVAGGVALVALLTGDDYGLYVDEGTLQYPLGYRNANAAFFLIAMWPAVTLAAANRLDWRFRALALGAATLCLELAALSQSRGSMIGVAVALVVFLVASRERARALAWLVLAVVPAAMVIPALADLYQTADLESYRGTAELRAAGRAALAGALLAIPLGAAATLLGRRRRVTPRRLAQANRGVAIGATLLVLAGAGAFTVATGDPFGWIGDRVDEFLTQGSPGSSAETSSRFGVNAGSERDDLWRVALDDAGDDPLLGTGGGAFQYTYLLKRGEEGIESVKDAHSVELETLSELGVPGLSLFALAIAAAAAGAWRARGLGVPAAALSTCALAAAAYWLAHSSLDWFWTYPAVTAPVLALLGSAAGSAAVAGKAPTGRWRSVAFVCAVVLAISVVPPYLAERYVDAAYGGWRTDPARAQADLDRARDLNPLSIEPLLAEGGIARASGDREHAIAAFEAIVQERPEEWASHYFLAELHRRSNPARAQSELANALRLNPRSDLLDDLRERVRPGQK